MLSNFHRTMKATETKTDTVQASAVEYYCENKCDHEECAIPDAEDLSSVLSSLSEDIWIDTVRLCSWLAST
eukprot:IDg11268t1